MQDGVTLRERRTLAAYKRGTNTYAAVARHHGVGVRAIRSRLYRARKKLKQLGMINPPKSPIRRMRACRLSAVHGLY